MSVLGDDKRKCVRVGVRVGVRVSERERELYRFAFQFRRMFSMAEDSCCCFQSILER